MDLLLWRHAEAADGYPDTERPLTSRGERQAERMAHWLDEHAPRNLRILVSPSVRTQQTILAWTEKYETTPLVGISASAADVLKVINWPDADDAVLVVGHQPTLGNVASLLLHGQEEDLPFKKGALWWLKYRIRDDETQTVLRAVMSADML